MRNYRYAVERTLRALGGWIALTPELSAKLLMGRHVWDLAQQCDAFGQRLPELRAHAHASEAANPAVAAFMDCLEDAEGPDQTIERLGGVYGVLKPPLLATYRSHLARANAVYEPPTRRILARCIDDERRHIAAGATILRHLGSDPSAAARAAARQKRLDELLAAAGGVTGAGLPADPAAEIEAPRPDLSDDAREFIRLEKAMAAWAIPEGLEDAQRSFAEALVKGDENSARGWLVPGGCFAPAASSGSRPSRCTPRPIVGRFTFATPTKPSRSAARRHEKAISTPSASSRRRVGPGPTLCILAMAFFPRAGGSPRPF